MKLVLALITMVTVSAAQAVGPLKTMNCDGGFTVRAAEGNFDAEVRTPDISYFITYTYRYVRYEQQNYSNDTQLLNPELDLSVPVALLDGSATEGEVTFKGQTLSCTVVK